MSPERKETIKQEAQKYIQATKTLAYILWCIAFVFFLFYVLGSTAIAVNQGNVVRAFAFFCASFVCLVIVMKWLDDKS